MKELEKKGKRITKFIKKQRKDAKKEVTIWKKAEKKKLKEKCKEINKENKDKKKQQKNVKKRQEWALKIEKEYDSTSFEDFEENITKLELDGKIEKRANLSDEDVEQKDDACMSVEARMKKSYGILKKKRKKMWLTKRAQEKKRMQTELDVQNKTHEVVAGNEKENKQKKSEGSKVNSLDIPSLPGENPVANDTDNVIEDILASDAEPEKEENKKKSDHSKVKSWDLSTPPGENPVPNDIDTDIEDILASDAKSEEKTDKLFVSIPTEKIRKKTVSGRHKFVTNVKKRKTGIHRPEPECELSDLSLSDYIDRKKEKVEKEKLEGKKIEQNAEIAAEEEKNWNVETLKQKRGK
ncbi:uncharacterized protein LOC143446839 isoform X3 [Clavelina lepadiformis]|uniref:uncharacterized protein LOC143446839 isoform X2 n=1 Tax=Clavelina lepadiformis TaxID=159417 RepID=UPI00404207E0